MNELTRFENDGIEVLIDMATGESFASASGYARMCGKSQSTISKRLKGMNFEQPDELKAIATKRLKGMNFRAGDKIQVETPGGLQEVTLIPALLAFQWAIKDNPELANKMGECGATVYLHKLAGFEIQSTALTPTTPAPIDKAEITNLIAEAITPLAQKFDSLVKQNESLVEQNMELLGLVVEVREQVNFFNNNTDDALINRAKAKMDEYYLQKANEKRKARELEELYWIDRGYWNGRKCW
jgi:hypothetical protein